MWGMGELYRVTEGMFPLWSEWVGVRVFGECKRVTHDGVIVWHKTVSAGKQLYGAALLFG
jgi:hypothetical protein